MFGKLKELAGNAAVKSVADQIMPLIAEQLEKFKSLSPESINDDVVFDSVITQPLWLLVSSSAGGVTSLYPPLKEKFSGMMRHVRHELVVVKDGKIELVDGFKARLPGVMLDGLKKP